jgi:hypothetical protein
MECERIKVANNDVIGATIARLQFCKANVAGLLIDDEGNGYLIDRFGTYVGRELHPADATNAILQRELEGVAFERLTAEEKEKRKSTSPWAL